MVLIDVGQLKGNFRIGLFLVSEHHWRLLNLASVFHPSCLENVLVSAHFVKHSLLLSPIFFELRDVDSRFLLLKPFEELIILFRNSFELFLSVSSVQSALHVQVAYTPRSAEPRPVPLRVKRSWFHNDVCHSA